MISRPIICMFWILCLSVGLFEVVFTPLKEAGIVAIYMSLMGLLREYSSVGGNTDFAKTGIY